MSFGSGSALAILVFVYLMLISVFFQKVLGAKKGRTI